MKPACRGRGLFAAGVILLLGTIYVVSEAAATLRQLDVVESERDRWQRPADILHALDLRDGDVVADLGSGAGYFALKISPIVGGRGEVLAVDIRRLSLSFLWLRATRRKPRNIRIIIAEQDDPHLPAQAVDAVLIANTYHEFDNPGRMLDHALRALRSGGRLVIVDRGPRAVKEEPAKGAAHGHEITLHVVEKALGEKGFEIVERQDPLIVRPGDDPWWLLVARKP